MGQDAFFRRTRCSARGPAAIGAAAVSCFAMLFLTMLCTLFYNIWLDDLRRLTAAEGDWQLRITGQFREAQLTEARGFAHVARASLCPAAGGSDADAAPTTALELVFSPASAAPDEGPLIAAALGLDHDAALAQNTLQYHEELLALLLVRAPGDTAPRLLLPFYLAVLGIACLSLVLILQSSFAVEMRDKLRELGVLASIGATPGQLLRRLVGQALALTALPCLAGLAAGVGLSALSTGALLRFRAQLGIVQGQAEAGFACHPAILTAALLAGFGTILLSALLPAARLCRLTPLEALRGLPERPAPARRGLLARLPRLAGPRSPEGMLAAAALRSQRQALRTGTLSLGMTPAQLRRMFAREALTLAGRPVLAALGLGAAALTGMIRASELDPAEFWAEAPVLPLLCFVLAVFALVGLAYYLGGRALLRTDLAETLRDETRE